MGNKTNPIGMRLQVNRTWDSRWYADTKDYGDLLMEDIAIRDFIHEECKQAGISRVIIERPHKKCRVTVHTARPGVIIGKKGADIETLRKKIANMTSSELHLNIVEVRKPELDARLVGESIAQQLERRVSFRRAMKRAVQNAMRMGALGIRVNVAGRLGGAEIARTEWYREGRVPLHTLRADIDHAHVEATTAYGIIGIKVWIFKGEIMEHDPQARDRKAQELQDGPAPRGAGGRR
ncbi:30S ribosomal protein S3 [Marinovum sp. 2_MG-2023]|uniref:30S ribosomal protein S3 n=1 Tax=Roseobacteraceae TaxID=2854170 RepID=UPI001FD4F151|nr:MULTISPECIES: 30S ribosomal protein S3 [Roseobacteraceae]MCJ7872917.1 30S ribosomal protein S3 [Phaeobacter sp. J2-8]MDO6731789.1 30S ribosomal protein S3 [Marinovum sp. 2_MG-2023]MDO6781041.1 30S ribosomal protein S3 [Marinovum sp. 1_MG-2023]